MVSLALVRAWGRTRKRLSGPSGSIVLSLALVAAALLIAAPALDLVAEKLLKVEAPELKSLLTVRNLVLGTLALVLVRWLARARERVLVEEFVDYTTGDGKAVEGLATLLVSELGRLRELYAAVNEGTSVPTSVGIPQRGGAVRGRDPGTFLPVRVDDVTEVLSRAVATEAKIKAWGIEMPIGLVLSLLGRIARGPRVIGSVHYTHSGGGPTLTAQVVGRGQSYQWRVDGGGHDEVERAFLEPMVTEIACRMFNDLTLRNSVRWRAVEAFTGYLELYWESLRTPKSRAGNLKRAEGKLLEAIAHDETFDLAYYNLGVIYSQLAETEKRAARASAYVDSDPEQAYQARTEAAIGAFTRALELNRDRWEAVYALAVHQFSRTRRTTGGDLECVLCHCRRVLELVPGDVQTLDLKGMAEAELDDLKAATKSHRRAVRAAWRDLRKAERQHSAKPVLVSPVPAAKANAAAALMNLALVYNRRAEQRSGPRRRLLHRRADRRLALAERLAPAQSLAGTLFARGENREEWNRHDLAAASYERAVRLDPEHPVHWARLARAQARSQNKRAEQSATTALVALASWYRRTLEPFPAGATEAARDDTLEALEQAYRGLGRTKDADRMAAYGALATRLAGLQHPDSVPELEQLAGTYAPGDFEREQVLIVLARVLVASGAWEPAAARYAELIAELNEHRPVSIRRHDLHAKHARALRRADRSAAALEAAAQAVLLDPLSPVARREVGKAQFALGQLEEALEAWKHTLWLTPNDPHLYWRVGYCHWHVAQDRADGDGRRRSLLAAAESFERAALLFGVEMVEGWAWSELWAGRAYAELGEAEQAITHLRNAAGCCDTKLPASLELGEAYCGLGATGPAREQLERACRRARERLDREAHGWGEHLTPRQTLGRAELALARVALTEKDRVRAREHAERARRLGADVPDGWERELTAGVVRAGAPERNGHRPKRFAKR